MRLHVGLAPFASLFLILMLLVTASAPSARGLPVKIAYQSFECCDSRPVVAEVLLEGGIQISGDRLRHVTRQQLAIHLREIFHATAERVLFLKAAPGVEFQSISEIIGIAKPEVDYIAILTPAVEGDRSTCLSIRLPLSPPYVVKPHFEMKFLPPWPW